jgi:hypothetical protein
MKRATTTFCLAAAVAATTSIGFSPGSVSAATSSGGSAAQGSGETVPAEYAYEHQLRGQLGLSNGVTYLLGLHDDLEPGRRALVTKYGMVVTPEEAADLDLRQRIAETVQPEPLSAPNTPPPPRRPFYDYVAAHQEELVGEWIDQLADGLVHVVFTGHVEQHQAALGALFPFAGHLVVEQAPHPYSELVTGRSLIEQQVGRLRQEGVDLVSFGPDVRTDSVVVALTTLDARAEAALRAAVPGVPVSFVQSPPRHPTGDTMQSAPPVRAGQNIYTSDGNFIYSCTSSFIVTDGSSYYVSTAGHCGFGGAHSGGSTGNLWIQGPTGSGNYIIGTTRAVNFGSNDDAEILNLEVQGDKSAQIELDHTHCGFLGLSDCYNLRNVRNEENFPVGGEVACLSGARSGGEKCATVTAIDQCVTYGAPTNLTLCHQEFANYPAISGDSGGPWYQPQSSGTSLAQGIESGSDGQTSNYTQIVTAYSGLGTYFVVNS